jgi:hypothetical protein
MIVAYAAFTFSGSVDENSRYDPVGQVASPPLLVLKMKYAGI